MAPGSDINGRLMENLLSTFWTGALFRILGDAPIGHVGGTSSDTQSPRSTGSRKGYWTSVSSRRETAKKMRAAGHSYREIGKTRGCSASTAAAVASTFQLTHGVKWPIDWSSTIFLAKLIRLNRSQVAEDLPMTRDHFLKVTVVNGMSPRMLRTFVYPSTTTSDTIKGLVAADVGARSRQISPARSTASGWFGSEFGGKGFVRLLVYSTNPPTTLAQPDQITLTKTTDTKASALLIGDIVIFRCRAQFEAVAAVRIDEAFDAAKLDKVTTWELDYCRLETPNFFRALVAAF